MNNPQDPSWKAVAVTTSRRLALVIALTTGWLHAAPYGPDGKAADYRQSDGTRVGVRVFGDEYYAVAETLEGYTVVYDKDKVLTYGNLSADGKKIVSTGIRASNNPDHAKLQSAGIKKKIRLSPEGRKAAVIKGLQRMRADKKGRVTPQSVQYYSEAAANPGAQFASPGGSEPPPPPPSYAPPTVSRVGNYVGLCILVDFSDQPGTIASSSVDDYCNKPGYTGYNNSGSIYDYFFKQSGGRLRYNNIVTAYVRVPNPKTYYDDGSTGSWGNSKAQTLVLDALNVLMAQGFDFTKISRNASGVMYSVNVFYAGTCASPWSTGLWPGSWAIPTKTVDVANGIKAYSYQITDIGTSLEIGTFCHESGHMLLDYPDLYPYDGNAANLATYSLMSGGNGTDGGRHPTNIDPYLKNASGWTNIVDLNSTSHQRCTIQADSNLFYRYRNPAKIDEYFLFEVRDNTGYEGPYGGSGGSAASVNPSAGLVAYHVREDGSNPNSSIFTASNPNCVYTIPYEMLLVEANQQTAKTPWYDDPTPDTGDAFKSTGKSEISDITTPELKFWDATGRNTASGAVIHSISADGPTMTFVAGAGAPTGSASIALSRTTIHSYCDFGATAASQTFSIGNGGGGTLSYTISTNQTWLSCASASGTATTEGDTITVDFSTSGLAAGSYSATITVTDPAASPTTKTITVNLTVNPQPVIALSTASIIKAGIAGSSGPQASFAIRNTGGGTMNYAVSKTQPWLSLTPSSGTVVGETDIIYIDFNATSLARGTYNDTITITSAEATNSPLTIPVTFAVDGADMIVSAPNGGENWVRGTTQTITWASEIGGNVKIELLKNSVINTTISATTPNDGSYSWTIPAGQTLGSNYRMRITSVETPTANDLSFEDFEISAPATTFYTANMDTNPGWTLQGAWAWGDPTGTSGDPQLGYTGTNVIGYNLAGTYTNSLAETHATTPAIDCSRRSNVQLSFYRWLGIERGDRDKAYVRVSNNGTTWTNVFAHNTISNATSIAAAWSLQTYDISAVADGAATVYVRWTMGTTDTSITYAGWNIDDVVLVGKETSGGYAVVATQSGGTTSVTEDGATDTYTLHLAKQPSNNVTVNITHDSQVGVSPTSLTFTSVNWATPQTITVNATNDLTNEFSHTGTINSSATSADADYNAIGIDGLLVNITDNDNATPVVNVGNDQSVTLTGVSWTPADVGPLAWYDATDSTTITQVAGAVSQWADKVGTSHMVQATSANQPLSGTTTINGLNSISFDGTNDALKTTTNPFGASISNAMMMGVFNIGTITNSTLFSLTGTSANRWQSHAPWDANMYFDCGGSGGVNRISGLTGWAAGQNKLLGFYCSTTDNAQQVWVDGTSLLSDATGHTVSTTGGLSLGYDGGGSYDNCRMGEVVVINGAVSANNRQKLEGFLAHKWGLATSLPGAHPYKAQPPTNSAAIANLDGTVSDANGDPLTTAWTVVSGPASVSFANVDAVDTTASFSVAGTYTLRLTASDPGASISDDVVITVNASSDFAVTYAGNTQSGGTPPPTQVKSPGVNLTLATNSGGLVKTGHSFVGWNTASNGGGTDYATGSTYSTDANLPLYAKWIPDTYLITYSANGATSGTAPAGQTKTHGVSLTLATNTGTLAKTGYTFAGWNTAADGTGTTYAAGAAYTNNAPVTFYAKWTIVTYAVNYNSNTATSGTLPGNQTKTYGIDLTLQTNTGSLARAGYTFAGWNTLANGTGTPYAEGALYTANAAATLYAKWTPANFTVTFNANGGGSPNPTSKIVTYNSTYGDLATVSYPGNTFNGWFTAASGGTQILPTTTVTITGNQTVYAQWTAGATYTVAYNANGADSGTVPADQTKLENVTLTLSNNTGGLARAGYAFAGWNTAANGSGTPYAAGAAYTDNAAVILYAQWAGLATYTITYDGNGNTGGSAPSNQTKAQGVGLVLATNSGNLTKTGFSFTGWNTAANGNGTAYAPGATYTADASTALYAQWAINTYAITYDGNGSTAGSVSNQTKTHDVNLTLSGAGTLIKTGYLFTGWNTAADGTGSDYAADATYSTNAPLALFAKWDRLPTILTLNPTNGATGVSPSGDLVITFSENIAFGTGEITLHQSNGTLVESFNVASPPASLTLSGATVTLNPTSVLAVGITYYVEIDATAIDDLAGNGFAGINGSGNWSFTILPFTLADSYLASLDVASPTSLYSSLSFPSYLDGPLTGSSTLTTTGYFGSLLYLANNGVGNTFTGNITVDSGTLRLTGSPFATTTGGFTAPGMTSSDTITINRAGTLYIDDNVTNGYTADRFGTSGERPAVNIAGGTLTLNGRNNASSSVQTLGTLTVSSGTGTINALRVAATPTLTFSSLSISKGAQAVFNGTNLGTGTNDARIIFTSAPSPTSGILAGARFWDGNNNAGEFATYGANGVRSFTAADYTDYDTDINTATSTQNVRINNATIAAVALTGDLTVNSLNYAAQGGWNMTNKLTIVSGMFLKSGDNSDCIITSGTLTAGTGSTIDLHLINGIQNISMTTTSVIADNGVSGVVTLVKSGDRNLNLTSASNNTYSGGTYVLDGNLTTGNTANTRYLSSGKVTVDGRAGSTNSSSLTLGNVGATSNSIGDDYTAINGGKINVANVGYISADTFNVAANSIIAGASGSGTGLASLTRGANITLASGAIIGHNALSTALNTSTGTIQSLGTNADVYYGLNGNQTNSGGQITIGNGTAFKGISTDRSGRNWEQGTINIASGTTSVDFQGHVTHGTAATLTLGNGVTAGNPVMTSAVAGTVDINAIGPVTLNDDAAVYGNTGSSQNVRFMAKAGSTLTVTAATGMGSGTGIASALINNGGSLAIGNTASLNGTVTVEAGGQFNANQAAGLTGAGALTFNEGSILNITNATGFSGTQAAAASVAAGTIVKLSVGNFGTTSTTLDSVLGSGSKNQSYLFVGNQALDPSVTPGAVYTLNKSSGGVGGILTNDAAARTINALTNGRITLGANGGVMVATTGTTLTVAENIDGGALTIGTTAIIDGAPKLGTVSLSAANTHTGGTTVNAGTLTMGNASALGSTSGQLTVNGGTLNMAANSLTVGNLTGTGGVINGTSGTRTLTIGQGDFGGGNYQGVIANGTGGTTAITKTGTGTITLSGANTYTGATAINVGKLFISGNQSSASGNVTVATNATLGGTGTISGSTTIAAGGKLEFNLNTIAASHDPLNIASGKSFTFSGASELTITSSGGIAAGTYTLVTGGNNITGIAPATVNMPAGWLATASISGNSLVLDVTSAGVDSTAPTLVSITDDQGGASIVANTTVNYTVTFSEDMDATTVQPADFGNAGTASGTIDSVTETSPGVFLVSVTPSSAGSLQLRINAAAVLGDLAGLPVNTTSAILDDTTITVNAVNVAPAWTSNPVNEADAAEDSVYAATLADNAGDANGNPLAFVKVSGPAWLSVAPDGTLSGTPVNSNVGANSFTVSVSDGIAAPVEATLNIVVINTNDAPVFAANPITGSDATEDAAYIGTLAGSASDVDAGATLIYAKVSGPAWLNVAADGVLTGTPDNSNVGANSYTVSVSDGIAAPVEATLNITVINTNDAPVFAANPITGGDATEDVAYNGTIAGSASDVDSGAILTFVKVSGPAWLSVAADGTLSGTPSNSDVGASSFTVSVSDSISPAVEATLNITVVNTNDSPVFTANPITGSDATEDAAYSGTIAGSASDVDAGATLTFAKVSGPSWLNIAADGSLTGTPDNSNVGANSFTVSVTDGIAAAVEATLNITVINTNDAPVFAANPITGGDATEDAAYTGTLAGSASDVDAGATLIYAKVSGPAWLNVAADGVLSGTPANINVGANSFTVSVSDSIAPAVEATLNITVINTNDAPTWASNPITGSDATENAAYIGTLAGSASDVDAGATLIYTKVSGPAWLNVAADGVLSGTPANINVGANSFTVSVSDSIAPAVEANLNITVINTNDAPAWAANPVIGSDATEDAAYSGSIASSASDPDSGAILMFAKVSGPAWLSVASNGALSGTPDNSNVGANSFTVSVTDGIAAAVQATLNITVTNTNDAPVFTTTPIVTAGATETVAYTGQTIAGSATDADAGDSITYSKVSGPVWLNVASNGTLSGTPGSGTAGLNSFVVRATDSTSATADATLEITVTGLPLPWVSSDIGTGMLAGSTTFSGGTFTQAGSGIIGSTTDKLRFTYQTLTGDGEIIARISSLQNTGTSSRVGVMIRDTLAANSKQIFMGMTGSNAYRWVRRTATGGSTSSTNSSSGTIPNAWVRLVRSGTTITAYKSSNGTTWTTVGSTTGTTFASTCYIGLAVGSGSDTTLNASQFSNLSVTP